MSVQRKQPIVIEVLYFDGCPSHLPTVDLVQRVSDELGVSAQITQVEVTSDDDLEQFRFLGSPTVRVNGVDVEPSARHREEFGFTCRVYGDGPGAPPRQMVADAIRRAAGGDTVADSSNGRNSENLNRWTLGGSLVAAALASACCWLPLLLLAFGVSGATLGAAFEPLRPLFMVPTFGLLASAFYFTYRPRRVPSGPHDDGRASGGEDCCAVPGKRKAGIMVFNKVMLWAVTVLAVVFLLFPSYVGLLLGAASDRMSAEEMNRTVIHVDGMTCEGCCSLVADAIRDTAGVIAVEVDFHGGKAVVGTDAWRPVPEENILAALREAGYRGMVSE